MSHDEEKYPDSILPGCRVLLLDEVHSGSTDIELILANSAKNKACSKFPIGTDVGNSER